MPNGSGEILQLAVRAGPLILKLKSLRTIPTSSRPVVSSHVRENASLAVEFAQGVDVGDEFIVFGKFPSQLHLQIALWIVNPDAIILGESFEQVDSLVNEAIPGFAFLVFKWSVPERAPFLEECRSAVVSSEVSRQRVFEATPEAQKESCEVIERSMHDFHFDDTAPSQGRPKNPLWTSTVIVFPTNTLL